MRQHLSQLGTCVFQCCDLDIISYSSPHRDRLLVLQRTDLNPFDHAHSMLGLFSFSNLHT